VLRWIKEQGGVASLAAHNQRKAGLIYRAIDMHAGFYRGHAEAGSRSLMNITFRLPEPELENQFAKQAEAAGMIGLKGHRSVGGIRVSAYNAMSYEGCAALAGFMDDFARRNG
jgi:phosphoserine aminotransferase